MRDPVSKYIFVPLVAVIGLFVVGSVMHDLFGVAAIALFVAVGGVAFIAKLYKSR